LDVMPCSFVDMWLYQTLNRKPSLWH